MTIIDSHEVSTFIRQVSQVNTRVGRIRAEAGTPEPGSVLAAALIELEAAAQELEVASEELRVQQEQLSELHAERPAGDDLESHLLHRLPVALLVCDAGGIVLNASAAACALLERPRSALEGLPISVLAPPDGRRPLRDALSRLAAGSEEERLELASLQLIGQPGSSADGPVTRWVLTDQPVSGPEVVPAVDPATAGPGALVLSKHTVDEVLAHVTRSARRALPGTAQVSVTLRSDGERPVPGLDDSPAGRLTALQHVFGEGPTLDALASGMSVHADLARDRRWPKFARAALGHGVGGVLAEPLTTGSEPVGVLTVYGAAMGEAEREIAGAVARSCAATLEDALAITQQRRLVGELSQALTSRATIDQARGIIMAQTGCTEEEAFDRLRSASQRENVKLRVLAERLVESSRTHARRRR